jgi:hypothetical protein
MLSELKEIYDIRIKAYVGLLRSHPQARGLLPSGALVAHQIKQ